MRRTTPRLPALRRAAGGLLLAAGAEEGRGKGGPDRDVRDAPLLRAPFIAQPSAHMLDGRLYIDGSHDVDEPALDEAPRHAKDHAPTFRVGVAAGGRPDQPPHPAAQREGDRTGARGRRYDPHDRSVPASSTRPTTHGTEPVTA